MSTRIAFFGLLVGAAGFGAGWSVTQSRLPAGITSSLPITDPGDPDIRMLLGLQQHLAASLAPFDSLALDSLLPEDMRAINAGDQVLDKATTLRMLRDLSGTVLNVVDDSILVRRYGDVAVMTLRETVRARAGTGEAVGRLRMTELWLKRDGRWRAVASHASVIR
jgi:hypothetical protein